MTPTLVGKNLVLGCWPSKIEAVGIYNITIKIRFLAPYEPRASQFSPSISLAPLISLDGKQQGHGSHRLLTTSSSFARVWRWKKSQVEHHHHVPGIQVYCAFWGKYCSGFRVSRKNCKALQLFPPWYLPCCHLNLGAPNQTTRPCRKSAWRAAWPWTDEHLWFGTWHFEMIDSLGNLHIYSPKTKIAPWKQHISKAKVVFKTITLRLLH